jgi:hypothetical protein
VFDDSVRSDCGRDHIGAQLNPRSWSSGWQQCGAGKTLFDEIVNEGEIFDEFGLTEKASPGNAAY